MVISLPGITLKNYNAPNWLLVTFWIYVICLFTSFSPPTLPHTSWKVSFRRIETIFAAFSFHSQVLKKKSGKKIVGLTNKQYHAKYSKLLRITLHFFRLL